MFTRKKLILILFTVLMLSGVYATIPDKKATEVTINAVGGMQYDVVRFRVKPGSVVRINLSNKDDMSHNLVITAPGNRLKVVNAASALADKGEKMNYVPEMSDVLESIPILEPGENRSVTFKAPTVEGVYPYVCTYPGHGFVMYGAMYVGNKDMPAIKDDENIPPKRREDIEEGSSNYERAHSYREEPPFLYRTFLPDASPSAIAVNLPHHLSYCWDAATCNLRYAWKGDFLDNTDIWKGHHDSYGVILGTIFFKDRTEFPLQVDKLGNIPMVEFKGYRLVDRYPEFHYTIDGIDVFELIKPQKDGSGLIRTFRIPKTEREIWFVKGKDGVIYQSSEGRWNKNGLRLMPKEARQFTLTMTIK